MEALKSWIITICSGVIFITTIEIILPDNSMKKYAKFVLGLILMTVIISPIIKFLGGGTVDVSSYLDNYQNIIKNEDKSLYIKNEENVKSTQEVFEKNIEKSLISALKINYPKDNFEADIKTTYDKKENLFSISRVEVKCNKGGIKKIEKIEIGKKADSNLEGEELEDGEMKAFIAKTINVNEKCIYIYNLDE